MRRILCATVWASLALVAIAGVYGQRQNAPLKSELCIYDLGAKSVKCVLATERHIEAPNWTPDGKFLLVNSGGSLYEVELANPMMRKIDTGSITRLNNDHGVSPDGKLLVISAGQMYTLPRAGGTPMQITSATPSYYHGWSPDGKMLAFCAQREKIFDLYAISVDGGAEVRLTATEAHEDGPDYSPDGKWIYFNSDRGGTMAIWRIPAVHTGVQDAKAERIIGSARSEWFPHPSPDGKWLVYLSFPEGTEGHPANKPVELRIVPVRNGNPVAANPQTLVKLTGGQGTINVNSWAPDSKRFAFVRYEYAQ